MWLNVLSAAYYQKHCVKKFLLSTLLVQLQMRITDWNSWRRLGAPAPRQAARRSLTVNVSDADVQCAVA